MTSDHTISTPNFDGKGLLSIPNFGKGFGLGFSVVTNPAEIKGVFQRHFTALFEGELRICIRNAICIRSAIFSGSRET